MKSDCLKNPQMGDPTSLGHILNICIYVYETHSLYIEKKSVCMCVYICVYIYIYMYIYIYIYEACTQEDCN